MACPSLVLAISAIVCDHSGMTTKRTAAKKAAAPRATPEETEGERLDRAALDRLAAAVAARNAAEDAVTEAVAAARNRPPHESRRHAGIVWDQIAAVLGMHQPNAVRKYGALLVQETKVSVRKKAAPAGRR